MGNDDYSTGEQAQGDQPFLSIIEPVVYEGDARPGENLLGVGKMQAVFNKVAATLRFIPLACQRVLYLFL